MFLVLLKKTFSRATYINNENKFKIFTFESYNIYVDVQYTECNDTYNVILGFARAFDGITNEMKIELTTEDAKSRNYINEISEIIKNVMKKHERKEKIREFVKDKFPTFLKELAYQLSNEKKKLDKMHDADINFTKDEIIKRIFYMMINSTSDFFDEDEKEILKKAILGEINGKFYKIMNVVKSWMDFFE